MNRFDHGDHRLSLKDWVVSRFERVVHSVVTPILCVGGISTASIFAQGPTWFWFAIPLAIVLVFTGVVQLGALIGRQTNDLDDWDLHEMACRHQQSDTFDS